MTDQEPREARCLVCGLSPEKYPSHWRMHDRDVEDAFDADRVVWVESLNLTLRIELGLPPWSGGRP